MTDMIRTVLKKIISSNVREEFGKRMYTGSRDTIKKTINKPDQEVSRYFGRKGMDFSDIYISDKPLTRSSGFLLNYHLITQ